MIASPETAVSEMIAKSYTAAATASSEPEESGEPIAKFEFDAEFQTKLMILAMRSDEFMRKVSHVLKAEYFENAGEANVVSIAIRFYEKYKATPNTAAAYNYLKEDIANKRVRSDLKDITKAAFVAAMSPTTLFNNESYFADEVAGFARHQAMSASILKSVELLERREFDKIETTIKAACNVGINKDMPEYDFYGRITDRTEERSARSLNTLLTDGITTGHLPMDQRLFHKGWGRKELSVIMGGAKSGKTTALINFAKAASMAKFDVLYVTLEVSAKIIGERLDACISDTEMKALVGHMHDVKSKIDAVAARSGKLMINEFGSGTFSPNDLRALIERYKSPKMQPDGTLRPGITFDMVVVDYADIMAPNNRSQDVIENSKNIYLDLRAIAFEENVAMLTATQTNREGYKAIVAKAEHASDDFNKVRTADIMISINATEEERANGEARLYFAASRNQEGNFTIFVKQALAKMQFITGVWKIE